jgi:transcriptional regulator with XRE-family HTH domain
MSIKWPRAIIIAVDSANRTIGIKYFIHPDGRIVAEIPALKQLMRLIARDLVLSKSGLTGGEVRFLRKRLGKKATDYCKYLGLEPETLSRIENGKQTISSATQKLARLSYAILSEEPGLYDHARTILQSMLEELKPAKEKLVLEIDNNSEWREAA